MQRINTSVSGGEFHRGWHVVLLGLVGLATSASVTVMYAFGSMVVPLQQAFGWSRGEIQTAMTFYTVGSVVSMQLAGWLINRHGLRLIALVSLPALSAFYLLLTQIVSLPQLYIGCALITFAGVGTLHITWTQIITLWFSEHRGAALAITLTGSGLAAAVLPSVVTWGITQWGWQAGFVILAMPPILLALPLASRWLTDAGPVSNTVACTDQLTGTLFRAGIRMPAYWFMSAALVLVMSGILAMLINIVPMLQDKGLSAATASRIFGAYGIALIVGRLLVGFLMDRFWAPAIAWLTLSLPAAGCLIYLFAEPTVPLMVLATLMVGTGVGAEIDVAAFLVSRYFGLRDYARLFGLLMAMLAGGGCIAPVAFGALYDRTGSYDLMLWVCAAIFIIGPLLLLGMGKYPDFGSSGISTTAEDTSLSAQPVSALQRQ
jgi:MFS family permease